ALAKLSYSECSASSRTPAIFPRSIHWVNHSRKTEFLPKALPINAQRLPTLAAAEFFRFRRQESPLRSNGKDVCDNRFALGRFQTRAVRHTVHDLQPIVGAIMPERWQRVAFYAAMGEKRAAFAQHRKIGILGLSRRGHPRS